MDKTAAAKPVLNKIWWDKNKAKTLLKTGVGQSLADFELAFDRAMKGTKPVEDEKAVQKAATDAKKTIIAAKGKANKTLHADTITALTNMEKLLDAELKKSVERSKKTPPAPKQDDRGKPDVLYSIKVADKVRAKYNPAWIATLSGYELTLTLNSSISRALQSVEGGGVKAQEMNERAQKVGEAAVDDIVNYIKKIDAGSAGAAANLVDKARKGLQPYIDKRLEKAQQDMKLIPAQVWALLPAAKAQYREYKIDSAVTVTKGVVSVTVSAAALAGSHGASLALSIVGIVRGTAAIVKTLYDLSLEASKVGVTLMADVSQLQKDYYDAAGKINTGRQAAQEITGTVLKSALGTDCPFLVTLPKVTSNYDLWSNKIAGVYEHGSKLSDRITRIIVEIDRLEGMIKNAEGTTVKKVYNDLLKMRASLDESLQKTDKVMSQSYTFREAGPTVKKTIDDLNKDNTTLNKVLDVLIPTLTDLGLAAAGAGLDFKAAESAFDVAKTAVTFANDLENIGQDALEAALGK